MQAPPSPSSSSGDRLDLRSLKGALLYIEVREVLTDFQTAYGPVDAVRADIAVLDGDHKGNEHRDALIFPWVLVSQLRQVAGSADPVVVGRLTQGSAKPGRSAPWILDQPTTADLDIARRYEAHVTQRAAQEEDPF